jgi:hypothetical protein
LPVELFLFGVVLLGLEFVEFGLLSSALLNSLSSSHLRVIYAGEKTQCVFADVNER